MKKIALLLFLACSFTLETEYMYIKKYIDAERENKVQKILVRYNTNKELVEYIFNIANEFDMDPLLIIALIKIESDFVEHAVSSVGAYGTSQISRIANIDVNIELNRHNTYDNILISILFLKKLLVRFNGDLVTTLRYYNGGNIYDSRRYSKKTQRYARNIFKERNKLIELTAN